MKIWLKILLSAVLTGNAAADDKTVLLDEGRMSLDLPSGWKESEQDQKGSDSIGGFESSDRKTSFYVLELKSQNQADDVFGALDRTINRFDQEDAWIVKKISKAKSVDVNGLPAAYTRVELDLVSGEREVPFVFYFTMVGARNAFFLLQASTIKPVRGVREEEVFRMTRSFKILKE